VDGRGQFAQDDHDRIVQMIEQRDEDGADEALRKRIFGRVHDALKQEAAATQGGGLRGASRSGLASHCRICADAVSVLSIERHDQRIHKVPYRRE